MSDILIVPDIHAGFVTDGKPRSRIADLVAMLADRVPKLNQPRIIFLGDVLDFWRATPADALADAAPLILVIKKWIDDGIQVDYILGNHDYHLLADLQSANPQIVNHLPHSIKYYHRYHAVSHNDKQILIAHGDDYDFLYISLEEIDPFVPGDLQPKHIYFFYEWMFRQDKQIIASLEKDGLRGLFLAWLKHFFLSGQNARDDMSALLALPAGTDTILADYMHEASRPSAAFLPQGRMSRARPTAGLSSLMPLFSLGGWLARFFSVSLQDIAVRTPTAQAWSGIANFSPFKKKVSTIGFQKFDHLIVGHFHDPRQEPGLPITDAGSWVIDPTNNLRSGTHVEIVDGTVLLWQYPNVYKSMAIP